MTKIDNVHVNKIMLHVNINKSLVNIIMLHVDIIYLACREQKYATIQTFTSSVYVSVAEWEGGRGVTSVRILYAMGR